MKEMLIKEKRLLFLLTAATVIILSGISAGVASAYLSAQTKELRNVITTGTIDIVLTEEHWDPSGSQELVPGSEFAKDPSVTNTGKNAAHVFLEIRIPRRMVSAVGEDGRKQAQSRQELFRFQADTENWVLVKHYEETDYSVYVYGFYEILYPGQTTSALFEKVSVLNYLEGNLDPDESFTIDVKAKAIQTGVETVGGTLEEMYEFLLDQLEYNSKSTWMDGRNSLMTNKEVWGNA